jgi:putative phosphoesterase
VRFAIITDVHGNLPALQAVLLEIDEKYDVDHIYCLGDMIAIGPHTNEVLEILFSREDVSMVTGNHDEAVLAVIYGEEHPESHAHAKKHHEWVASELHPRFVTKLKNLPRTIVKHVHGKKLFFSHYHYKLEQEQHHICNDPHSPIIKKPTIGLMEALFANISADLISFGHHHPVHHFTNDKTIYLNPGSLGCHEEAIARFAVINVTSENISVELKQVSYDKALLLADYENYDVVEREVLMKIFHGS